MERRALLVWPEREGKPEPLLAMPLASRYSFPLPDFCN
jgi:hypothetical protein